MIPGHWSAKRFGIIQWVICACALLFMTAVWPAGFVKGKHVSQGGAFFGTSSSATETQVLQQVFMPKYAHLDSISVYVENERESVDTMLAVFRVYETDGSVIAQKEFRLEEYKFPGWIEIALELDLNPKKQYIYTVGGIDGELFVAYVDKENKAEEDGSLFYQNIESPRAVIAARYKYPASLAFGEIVLCDCIIAAIAFLLLCLTQLIKGKAKLASEKAVKGLLLAGSVGLLGYAFRGIVVRNRFIEDGPNEAVLFIGVLAAIMLFAAKVILCRSETEPLQPGEAPLKDKFVHFLRSLLLAIAFWMSWMYTNGTVNYAKDQYSRLVLVFGALFLISLGRRKQIFHIPACVWSLAAFFIGRYHISLHSGTEQAADLAYRDAWVIWAVGMLILHLIYRVKDGDLKRLKDIQLLYFVPATVFFAICVMMRRGRIWPVIVLVFFLVWSALYLMTEERDRIWEDVCNGILLAFAGFVIFCLCRRPYQYDTLYRYGGAFHTVTVTAVYLLSVVAAAATKIIAAYRKGDKKKIVFSWLLSGVAWTYLVFTASRTGIFSAVIVASVAVVFTLRKGKGRSGRRIKGAVIMAATAAAAFCMTFSLTRIVPAMMHNPFYFDVEESAIRITADMTYHDDYLGERYMTIQRMMQMLFGRLFIPGYEQREPEGEEIFSDARYRLGTLLVSANEEDVADGLEKGTYDNGRMDIYKTYLGQLNAEGHDSMGAINEEGVELVHAHSSYLQTAFDFGIPMGIFFLILCGMTFVGTLLYARKEGTELPYSYLPFLVTAAFGAASVVEWVYHPFNPLGIVFFFVLPVCVAKEKGRTKVKGIGKR